MLLLDELRARVNLVDLATRLGLRRRAAMEDVTTFSLPGEAHSSVTVRNDEHFWLGGANGEQGHCIDLVMYVDKCGYPEANKRVHMLSGIHFFEVEETETDDDNQRKVEFICEQSLKKPIAAVPYLQNERQIPKAIIDIGIAKKTIGWTSYTNPAIAPGEKFHGGDGVSFIAYDQFSRVPVAIDQRYLDPKLNGDLKTISMGKKLGIYWTLDPKAVKEAHTIYVVEGALDALSIEAAFASDPGVCAIAQRGTQNRLDWAPFAGKTILCCFDNDEPKPDKRNPNGPYRRPGAEAEWAIHEQCLAANVACMFVDKREWDMGWDANDLYKNKTSEARSMFKRLEPWLIPGLIGDDEASYKRRLWLPTHDFSIYWRFHVRPDFTSKAKITTDNETGEERITFEDVAGIRIAGLSRVEIASATATMTGEKDLQPKINFVAVVQNARHQAHLQRKVMDDEQLHNIDHWRKFGPIFKPAEFARILNVFERGINIGGAKAANFVGLAWLNGRVVVNESNQCFFTDPKQQCPYSNALFSRGPRGNGLKVVEAYQKTFTQNAALLPLIWVVGAQLKIFLGFWPHMIMQANKGEGKSTLIKRLERTTGMKMFSGQSLATEFRLLTSVSGTSHPVGWEEISARKTDIINKAVSLLQESYQYTETSRGAALTEFLISAPVLLAGEDVPVDSLLGKTIRTDLTGKKGPLMPEIPQFPMHNWMSWLVDLGKNKVLDCYAQSYELCKRMCRAKENDSGAQRMITNYSALLTSWRLLSSWGGWQPEMGDVERDLIAEMNCHIAETSNDREPWIWIMETIFDEIAARRYPFPFKFECYPNGKDINAVSLRINQVMQHFSTSVLLRDKFNALPVKSGRVLKKQLQLAGVIFADDVRRSIERSSIGHMTVLDLTKLDEYGINPAVPEYVSNGYDN